MSRIEEEGKEEILLGSGSRRVGLALNGFAAFWVNQTSGRV